MIPFVLEIGVEEIPSAYLRPLVAQLEAAAREGFAAERLEVADLEALGTPRRLVLLGRVAEHQRRQTRTVRGPAWHVAYDAVGRPTRAAEGFARRLGVPVEALTRGRGEDAGYVVAEVTTSAEPAAAVLPRVLVQAGERLAPPRTMRWTADDVRFIRPVRWVVALLGDKVLEAVTLFGVRADRITYGNRTDAPGPHPVPDAAVYRSVLRDLGVEPDPAAREGVILRDGSALAREAGGELAAPPALLAEVADLVEWPVPFLGRFDPAYLEVPAPILETAMEKHQRYFPVKAGERMLPAFVGVRNGTGLDLARVIAGNEKVLRARLADAVFFWREDRRTPLAARVPGLDGVVLHARLGTMGEKVRRLMRLGAELGPRLGLTAEETGWLVRAAELAKADLLTHVVGEFPELQGIMGGIYAAADGEPEAVARAVGEHYRPQSAADALPATRVGQALALLDRLDALAGAEVAGLKPTGSEDPFALRRAALGAARILIDGRLAAVPVGELAAAALGMLDAATPERVRAVVDFVTARVRAWLAEEARGDLVDAVLAADAPWDSLRNRLATLVEWSRAGEFGGVLTTFKRVAHIAGDAEPAVGGGWPVGPERDLADALAAAEAASADGRWDAYWEAARALRGPVDRFFDAVLVMDPDPAVRARRLGLLAAVGRFLRRGADLTRVTGEAAGGRPGGAP
ncbi:MAG: glycine--tRNA ligase subunit beta [Actinomycetia bacterium]|nr:glycine--tRNA ligase subunit beta [Actinomycetes bacterium]